MRKIILITLGMMIGAGASAADLATIKARGYLVVATPEDGPPFGGGTAGQDGGFDTALLADLHRTAGIEIRPLATPRRGLLAAVIEGRADIAVGGIEIASDRENLIAFSRPLADAAATYLFRHDDTHIHGIADLDGRPFGTLAGNGAFTSLAQLEFRLAKSGGHLGSPVEFATSAAGTDALGQNKIDYLIEPAAVADWLVSATPDRLSRGETLSSATYFAWAFKRDNGELQTWLGKFFDGEAASGVLAKLQTASFGRAYPDIPATWDAQDWWYARKDRPIHFPVPGNGEPD